MSYLVVGLLGGAAICLYWYGLTSFFRPRIEAYEEEQRQNKKATSADESKAASPYGIVPESNRTENAKSSHLSEKVSPAQVVEISPRFIPLEPPDRPRNESPKSRKDARCHVTLDSFNISTLEAKHVKANYGYHAIVTCDERVEAPYELSVEFNNDVLLLSDFRISGIGSDGFGGVTNGKTTFVQVQGTNLPANNPVVFTVQSEHELRAVNVSVRAVGPVASSPSDASEIAQAVQRLKMFRIEGNTVQGMFDSEMPLARLETEQGRWTYKVSEWLKHHLGIGYAKEFDGAYPLPQGEEWTRERLRELVRKRNALLDKYISEQIARLGN